VRGEVVVAKKEDYIGKVITWREVINLFPDRWIAMRDYVMSGSNIVQGVLVGVMTDREADTELNKHLKAGDICRRTTFGGEEGYLNVRVFENRNDEFFPDAKREWKYNAAITGFGEGSTPAKLFRINTLRINSTEDKDYISIKDFFIACCDKKGIGASMILSSGLFNEVNLTFNNKDKRNRHIVIEHDRNVYNGNARINSKGGISRVFVFSQNSDSN
jgi:hypothetical protein